MPRESTNITDSSKNTYLIHSKDFSSSLLHLMESVHEVPVTGLGSHRIGSKQSHSEDFRLRIMLSGKSTANNVVIVNLHKNEHFRRK